MGKAIDLYTNMINVFLISSAGIIILVAVVAILIGVKKKKHLKDLCMSCGRSIDNDSIFCKYCGIRQKPVL